MSSGQTPTSRARVGQCGGCGTRELESERVRRVWGLSVIPRQCDEGRAMSTSNSGTPICAHSTRHTRKHGGVGSANPMLRSILCTGIAL
jgi:hypothetical protein